MYFRTWPRGQGRRRTKLARRGNMRSPRAFSPGSPITRMLALMNSVKWSRTTSGPILCSITWYSEHCNRTIFIFNSKAWLSIDIFSYDLTLRKIVQIWSAAYATGFFVVADSLCWTITHHQMVLWFKVCRKVALLKEVISLCMRFQSTTLKSDVIRFCFVVQTFLFFSLFLIRASSRFLILFLKM